MLVLLSRVVLLKTILVILCTYKEIHVVNVLTGHQTKSVVCLIYSRDTSTCHRLRKESSQRISCEQCPVTQTGDKPYSCSECEEKFTDENDLIIHERTHTGEKLYSCSECEENFTDENDLIMHERTHTGDRPYSCSDCDEKFAVESDLTKHERTHTSDKPYSCCQCGEKFNVESDLNLHAQTHTGDLPHSCS